MAERHDPELGCGIVILSAIATIASAVYLEVTYPPLGFIVILALLAVVVYLGVKA